MRVANELGAGRGKAAKFATVVSVAQSTVIGLIFCVLIMIYQDKFALIFSSSLDVLNAVKKISYLLAVTILLNSVQPVLSGNYLSFSFEVKYEFKFYVLSALKNFNREMHYLLQVLRLEQDGNQKWLVLI